LHPYQAEATHTVIATTHIPAGVPVHGFEPRAILARILAAVLAAVARARTRCDYERMMASDEILRDVGLRREDVRRTLEMGRS
jgi:uncharacterized protein YjiS (DUF1127 family)